VVFKKTVLEMSLFWSPGSYVITFCCRRLNRFSPPDFRCLKIASTFPRDFRQILDLIADIFGTQQEIVKRKTALQTAITFTHVHLIQ